MTIKATNPGQPISVKSVGRQFYRDVVHLLVRPGSFYEALPAARNRRDYLLFLGLTAVIYSVLSACFTAAHRPMFIGLYVVNALLMPVVTALVLHLVFRILGPERYTYGLLLGVTAYANVVLLLAWIPGMAPWAEMVKYVWIGLGLVKTGGISGLKAFFAIAATAVILVMTIYLFQVLVRF